MELLLSHVVIIHCGWLSIRLTNKMAGHLFGQYLRIQGKDMKGDLMRPTNI